MWTGLEQLSGAGALHRPGVFGVWQVVLEGDDYELGAALGVCFGDEAVDFGGGFSAYSQFDWQSAGEDGL